MSNGIEVQQWEDIFCEWLPPKSGKTQMFLQTYKNTQLRNIVKQTVFRKYPKTEHKETK